MRACYSGACGECQGQIKEGDEIVATAVVGVWRHEVCPEAEQDRADREALKQKRCAVCGLNHPGEC